MQKQCFCSNLLQLVKLLLMVPMKFVSSFYTMQSYGTNSNPKEQVVQIEVTNCNPRERFM